MKLYWVEFIDGIEDRDDVVVLDENRELAPQAAEAVRQLQEAEASDEPYELGEIYPLHAAAPDGTVYAIALTPVPAEVRA